MKLKPAGGEVQCPVRFANMFFRRTFCVVLALSVVLLGDFASAEGRCGLINLCPGIPKPSGEIRECDRVSFL